MFFSKEMAQYAIPFMGSDPSVVRRTQRFLHEEEKQSPVRVHPHSFPSFIEAVVVVTVSLQGFYFNSYFRLKKGLNASSS